MAKPKPNRRKLTALSKGLMPGWKQPPIDIPVADLRKFLSRYGPLVSVLITWSDAKEYQVLTVGADRRYADAAVKFMDEITQALKLDQLGPVTEDLRGDHPNVALTREQMNFILWMLRCAYAEKGELPEEHQKYLDKDCGKLMNIIRDAKKKLAKAPR